MRNRHLAFLTALVLALTSCAGDDAGSDPADVPADPPAEEADATAEEEDDEAEDTTEDEPAGGSAEAASLDCNTIEMMVPNAPGGGSDQQIRRLEPVIAEYFDTSVSVVYREGAGGALAWGALHDAEPDGCTVSNAVFPNLVVTSMEDGTGYAADDFTYFAMTEVASTTFLVANDARWETLEDFVEEARENPGALTLSGPGVPGEVMGQQMMDAMDVDLSYVPLDEGIGGSVPLLLGGHIDVAITNSSHATSNADTVRALALGGEQRVETIPDVPTFHELGYEGVTLMSSHGIVAPPEVPQDIQQAWQAAIEYAMDETEDAVLEVGLNRMDLYGDEALEYVREQMETLGAE